MEWSEDKSTLPLEILATSLATRLTRDELEWLSRVLAQRTKENRRKELMATTVRARGIKNDQVADALSWHILQPGYG
jgi:hypothetical protein